MQTFYSCGKLLISGEYAVLDGAKAFALPTKFGQSLKVIPNTSGLLKWTSLDHNGMIWYEDRFTLCPSISNDSFSNKKISTRIIQILNEAKRLNPDFLKKTTIGIELIAEVEFPADWGLGSSSTLINNIAEWAKVDAFELLDQTFGGSGYDIACAQESSPLIYQLNQNGRTVEPIHFDPNFKEHLYFVHLNKKQNSQDAINHYQNLKTDVHLISDISDITDQMVSCKTLHEFSGLMDHHERLISHTLNSTPIKEAQFKDFDGSIKSLGAWGGDFILVSSEQDPRAYFSKKGYSTLFPYKKMILI